MWCSERCTSIRDCITVPTGRCHTWCVSWRRIWSSSNSSRNSDYYLEPMTCIMLWRLRWLLTSFMKSVIHSSESHFTYSIQVILFSLSADYPNSSHSGQVQYQILPKYQCYSQSAASNRKFWRFPSGTSIFRLREMFNKSFGSSFTSIISSQLSHQPNQPIHSIINYLYHVSNQLCFFISLL